MNLEVFILGTGGMMPLPGRGLTSVLVRREGDLFLFDCGEGTQVAFRRLNLRWKRISCIFITHTHADHVTGLPGMLSLSSQVDRSDPLRIFGPPRTKEYVETSLGILDIYINYHIDIQESLQDDVIYRDDGFEIRSAVLNHSKPCVGYTLVEDPRPGVFHPERAMAVGVPRGPLWSRLQSGFSVELGNGRKVYPEDVLGPSREGRKVSFITDTLFHPKLREFVHDSDLLICEGMFSDDLTRTARQKKHLTVKQAAQLARSARVKNLGLIHYSPRYTERELRRLLQEAREDFPSTFLTRELQEIAVPYPDD